MSGFKAILNDKYEGEMEVYIKGGFYQGYDMIENRKDKKVLALSVHDKDGFPYGKLTTHLGEFISMDDSTYIDTNNFREAEKFIEDNHIGINTGFTKDSGYVTYPLYRISPFVLEKCFDKSELDAYFKEFLDEEKYEDPERYAEIMANPDYTDEMLNKKKLGFCEYLVEQNIEMTEDEKTFYEGSKLKELDTDEREDR